MSKFIFTHEGLFGNTFLVSFLPSFLVPLKEKGGSEEGQGLRDRKRMRDEGRGRKRGRGVREEAGGEGKTGESSVVATTLLS